LQTFRVYRPRVGENFAPARGSVVVAWGKSAAQRGIVAGRLANLKKRQRADRVDRPIGLSTLPQTAQALSVSERTVMRANAARREAAKAKPRDDGGEFGAGRSTTCGTSRGGSQSPAIQAKAAASGTNRGAVERMDELDTKRPDLEVCVSAGGDQGAHPAGVDR
jgi:hypothetical protein